MGLYLQYLTKDFHIHVPEGAPKDGPSVGEWLLLIAITEIPADKKVAMTEK